MDADQAAAVTGAVAELVAAQAAELARRIPELPAEVLGRLGDVRAPASRQAVSGAAPAPAPSTPAEFWATHVAPGPATTPGVLPAALPQSMGPVPVAVPVPITIAERLLGALEVAVGELDVTLPREAALEIGAAAVGRSGAGAPGTFGVLTATGGDQGSFAMPMQMLDQLMPGAVPTTAALLRAALDAPALRGHFAVAEGAAPAMAAAHGRAYLAAATVLAALVVRSGDRAHGTAVFDQYRPETVVGTALRVTVDALREHDMPPGWRGARIAERRRDYRYPTSLFAQLQSHRGRFALVEDGSVADPDATPPAAPLEEPDALAAAVPGGLVVATGDGGPAVRVTLELRDAPPPAPDEGELDEWDEVVELSYTAQDGAASLAGAPSSVWPRDEGHVTFPWPGEVRARVHARGRGSDGPERFAIALWEAPHGAPVVHRRRQVASAEALPWTAATPLVLTDLEHPAEWLQALAALRAPDADGFVTTFDVVEDARYAGMSAEALFALTTPHWRGEHHLLLVADVVTLTSPGDWPVLAVDVHREPGRAFRTTAAALPGIETNLSIANLDFADFADRVGPDGIYRGF